MRAVRFFSAFLLTLLLFWIVPRLQQRGGDRAYYDTQIAGYLLDHTAVGRHTGGIDPEISVWLSTTIDTTSFQLQVFYRSENQPAYSAKNLIRTPGSLDLFSAFLPRLGKSESYSYYIQLSSPDGNPLARLPAQKDSNIKLLFEGTPTLIAWVLYAGLLSLGMIYSFLALFDAVTLRTAELKLQKLARKVLATTFLMISGGVVAGALISQSRFGYLWGGWPFGDNRSQTMIAVLIVYWIILTILFKGTLFRFRPEKNIVSAGGAAVLTLLGVLFMITVFVAGDHFVGIPL